MQTKFRLLLVLCLSFITLAFTFNLVAQDEYPSFSIVRTEPTDDKCGISILIEFPNVNSAQTQWVTMSNPLNKASELNPLDSCLDYSGGETLLNPAQGTISHQFNIAYGTSNTIFLSDFLYITNFSQSTTINAQFDITQDGRIENLRFASKNASNSTFNLTNFPGCPSPTKSMFMTGWSGNVNTLDSKPISVREAPSEGSNVKYTLEPSTPIKLTDANPVCDGITIWWQIAKRGEKGTLVGDLGWAQEYNENEYLLVGEYLPLPYTLPPSQSTPSTILPTPTIYIPSGTVQPASSTSVCPNAPMTRLYVGAQVSGNPVYPVPPGLYETPNGRLSIETIPYDVTFQIVGGPQCVDDEVWWQAKVGEQTGWIFEVSSNVDYYSLVLAGNPVPDSTAPQIVGAQNTSDISTSQNTYPCADNPPAILSIGANARVSLEPGYKNNVRDTYSTKGKKVTQIDPGTEFTVIGGPECNEGHRWWQIRLQNGVEGWTVDGDKEAYWLELIPNHFDFTAGIDLCINVMPSRVQIGSKIRGVTDEIEVRKEPTFTSSGPLFLRDWKANIVNGPVCSEGYLWWQITYGDGLGISYYWIPERSPTEFYIVPLTEDIITETTPEVSPSETCVLTSVIIDSSHSNGVVSGKWNGDSPCNGILEIKNDRKYWVNYKLTPVGANLKLAPVGGANNLYAVNQVLGPEKSVQYNVSFSASNQTITVLLDVTKVSGDGASLMNFVQALVDATSYIAPQGVGVGFDLVIDYYPAIVNAFGAMPHLRAAADAVMTISPDFSKFRTEMQQAIKTGEFDKLAAVLSSIKDGFNKEIFAYIFKNWWGIFSALEIITRNYSNIYYLLFKEPAGFIIFQAN